MSGLPPYARLLGLRHQREGDISRFVMPFDDDVTGRPGYLHGGAIAGLLEFAALTTLAEAIANPDVIMKPVTVTVDYLRGGGVNAGDSHAEAIIERLGNRIANVEAVAWQEDRARPIATARINFLLERP